MKPEHRSTETRKLDLFKILGRAKTHSELSFLISKKNESWENTAAAKQLKRFLRFWCFVFSLLLASRLQGCREGYVHGHIQARCGDDENLCHWGDESLLGRSKCPCPGISTCCSQGLPTEYLFFVGRVAWPWTSEARSQSYHCFVLVPVPRSFLRHN